MIYCKDCKWWGGCYSKNSIVGGCRRFAPRHSGIMEEGEDPFSGVFPTTRFNDWCGDAEAKEPETKEK